MTTDANVSIYSDTLNASTMFAIHMADLALRTHLGASEIQWSQLGLVSTPYGNFKDHRTFSFGDGMVHVPGTETTVRASVSIVIKKVDDAWHFHSGHVQCYSATRDGKHPLPEGIRGFCLYFPKDTSFVLSDEDRILPTRTSRFPVLKSEPAPVS